jgi:hypothetical protein
MPGTRPIAVTCVVRPGALRSRRCASTVRFRFAAAFRFRSSAKSLSRRLHRIVPAVRRAFVRSPPVDCGTLRVAPTVQLVLAVQHRPRPADAPLPPRAPAPARQPVFRPSAIPPVVAREWRRFAAPPPPRARGLLRGPGGSRWRLRSVSEFAVRRRATLRSGS